VFTADQIGLPLIADRPNDLARTLRERALVPAPLLLRLADAGTGFASLSENNAGQLLASAAGDRS
jgi:3-hydroxyacyl-CoA dehydrogenase